MVIAIIEPLPIIVPVLGRARENTWHSSCLSKMKQLGLDVRQCLQNYDEKYPHAFPVAYLSLPLR
jgi:hypothetical protein